MIVRTTLAQSLQASSKFSFVFQSLISSMDGDEDVIPPSQQVTSNDEEVIPPSDAEEVESDGVDNSHQEIQVLSYLLCVTVQE